MLPTSRLNSPEYRDTAIELIEMVEDLAVSESVQPSGFTPEFIASFTAEFDKRSRSSLEMQPKDGPIHESDWKFGSDENGNNFGVVHFEATADAQSQRRAAAILIRDYMGANTIALTKIEINPISDPTDVNTTIVDSHVPQSHFLANWHAAMKMRKNQTSQFRPTIVRSIVR